MYIRWCGSGESVAKLTTKMCLKSEVVSGPTALHTNYAYILLNTCTLPSVSSLLYSYTAPVNKLTNQLRTGVAQAGFTEVLTFALVSQLAIVHYTTHNHFNFSPHSFPRMRLRKGIPAAHSIHDMYNVATPKTLEF